MSFKSIFLVTSVVCFGVGAGYFIATKQAERIQNEKAKFKVAVLVPASHPSMDAITEGFKATLKSTVPEARVELFNANGSKTLMKGQVEEIVASHYDLVFSVGTGASQMLKSSIAKHGSTMPLVFAAVSDPRAAGLIDTVVTDGLVVTGIVDHYNREEQLKLLSGIKDVKKPLLVYDPSSNPGFEKEREEIAAVFAKKGITLTSIPVFQTNEIQQKVAGSVGNYDLVMTLTDHTVCAGMDTLIKLCDKHGVTLFTSELDSNDKGAALSYGVNERDYGVQGAQMARQILNEKQRPEVTAITNFYLKLNRAALKRQGVVVSNEMLDLFEKTQVQTGE